MNRLTRAMLIGAGIYVVSKVARNSRKIDEMYRSERGRALMVALGAPDPGLPESEL